MADAFEMYTKNLVDQSVITASSENALFPKSNIQDARRSKVFRSTSNSDSVVFDFGETSDVNTCFIVADKRNGFGISTLTLQFNGTNSWGAPAATETITFSEQHGLGFLEFTTTHSYRFCRAVLTSTLGYCEVSKIYLGTKMELGRSINFGWSYKDSEIVSQKSNRYGQIFSDIISRQKTINASLSYLTKDQLDKIFEIYDLCGESKPFFVKIGCDNMINDNRRFSGMVYFDNVPTITNSNFNKYNMSISLKEAL